MRTKKQRCGLCSLWLVSDCTNARIKRHQYLYTLDAPISTMKARTVTSTRVAEKTHTKAIFYICSVILCALLLTSAAAAITTKQISGNNATELVQKILAQDNDIQILDVRYKGSSDAAATFNDGTIGFNDGIVLSTGKASSVSGTNTGFDASNDNGQDGDSTLDELAGTTTKDAAVLEFDFVPSKEKVGFRYVFSSDEYETDIDYNDVFAFYLNDENIALLPDGQEVSIKTVNKNQNNDLYRSNNPNPRINKDTIYQTKMDGLTSPLIAQADVVPGQTYTIRLAIADAADSQLDSNVFIQAGTFSADPDDWEGTEDPTLVVDEDGTIIRITGDLDEFEEIVEQIRPWYILNYQFKGKNYQIKVTLISSSKVTLEINGRTYSMGVGDTRRVDLDRDGIMDIEIEVEEIFDTVADLKIRKLEQPKEEIVEPNIVIPVQQKDDINNTNQSQNDEDEQTTGNTLLGAAVGIVGSTSFMVFLFFLPFLLYSIYYYTKKKLGQQKNTLH